jgi:Flp pilus assembly protein TadG
MLHKKQHRKGAALVEFAMVAPVFLLFVIGLVIGGLGVLRYQEVASLAREGARYASVHGKKYEGTTGDPAATPQDVYTTVIQPKAVALDPSRLSYSVTWDPDNRQGNLVSVQVSYQWLPEAFLGGMTLSSTSTVRVSY